MAPAVAPYSINPDSHAELRNSLLSIKKVSVKLLIVGVAIVVGIA